MVIIVDTDYMSHNKQTAKLKSEHKLQYNRFTIDVRIYRMFSLDQQNKYQNKDRQKTSKSLTNIRRIFCFTNKLIILCEISIFSL